MRIAFIGAGNMASALIGGLVKSGANPGDIFAIDPNLAARDLCARAHGVTTCASAQELAPAQFDAVVLAVKPQAMRSVAEAVAGFIGGAIVISIAAGIRLEDLSRWLGGTRKLIRAMPNTPALIQKGITGLAAMSGVSDVDKQFANEILLSVGATVWVDDEFQLDVVTAVSGSGPAYAFYFIEALQDAAMSLGLSSEQSRLLAVSTMAGASVLAAQSDESPQSLRAKVTSKGGTTAAAIESFDQNSIRERIIDGVVAARKRAAQMANEFAR